MSKEYEKLTFADDVSNNLLDFFNLILTGKGNTPLSKEIEKEVEKAKINEEWRMEYISLYMKYAEKFAEGREIGLAEGFINGCNSIVDIVLALRSGTTKEELLKQGYDTETIEQALKIK
ncbi:MAG: hypothetical protein K5662_01350 [Lachnospiraceae bacterium]|nr:hypothetical protein [Lachnospiraceae bacterium]